MRRSLKVHMTPGSGVGCIEDTKPDDSDFVFEQLEKLVIGLVEGIGVDIFRADPLKAHRRI